MWTIAYEFRCYIAVLFLGFVGRRMKNAHYLLLGCVVACLAASAIGRIAEIHLPHFESILGEPYPTLRFAAVFGTGSLFYIFQDRIPWSRLGCFVALAALVIGMSFHHLAERAFAVCGGYLIFWFALRCRPLDSGRWTEKNDISYGLYLYAWPIQNLMIWHFRAIDPWALCASTILLGSVAGLLSWTFVESISLRLANTLVGRSTPPVHLAVEPT